MGEPQATTDRIPSALASFEQVRREIDGKQVALFLDYDGTLTPIVERPEQAILRDDMRARVRGVAASCAAAVLSGRDLRDVKRLVAVDGIGYAGSHGFEIEGPHGEYFVLPELAEYLPLLDDLEAGLRARLQELDGVEVERKRLSLAVHVRRAGEEATEDANVAVAEEIARRPQLRLTRGKKVFDFQPDIDWHKGKALRHLLNSFGLAGPGVVPIYVGDDLTDEDAFRAIAKDGIGIVVRDQPRPTWARYALENPEETGCFLDALADVLETRRL
jgi:trehalose-phosphatase